MLLALAFLLALNSDLQDDGEHFAKCSSDLCLRCRFHIDVEPSRRLGELKLNKKLKRKTALKKLWIYGAKARQKFQDGANPLLIKRGDSVQSNSIVLVLFGCWVCARLSLSRCCVRRCRSIC